MANNRENISYSGRQRIQEAIDKRGASIQETVSALVKSITELVEIGDYKTDSGSQSLLLAVDEISKGVNSYVENLSEYTAQLAKFNTLDQQTDQETSTVGGDR